MFPDLSSIDDDHQLSHAVVWNRRRWEARQQANDLVDRLTREELVEMLVYFIMTEEATGDDELIQTDALPELPPPDETIRLRGSIFTMALAGGRGQAHNECKRNKLRR
jgi:hypothetical protein